VREALFALPGRFSSELNVQGVPIPDLHTLNAALGASIEVQTVEWLNQLRPLWDPDSRWLGYRFVRQPQRFPDVVLQATSAAANPLILLGIELKGWYVLAKEREPSFRYRVTAAVPTSSDLLCVMPWALDNVISGSPRLFPPYIVGARYAAAYRNYWWQHVRAPKGSADIRLSAVTTPYPQRGEAISDQAVSDDGGNFGRYSRTGLMDDYFTETDALELKGVPVADWRKFLARYS
jgi:hypothetical protein